MIVIISDRNVYRKNAAYRFVLRSFAYHFNLQSPADSEFSAVFNREDLGADHYELQGAVRKVEEIAGPFLGQKAWNVHVVVANSEDGEEMLLPGNTHDACWRQGFSKPGDSVQALVWLQGHLWGAEEDSEVFLMLLSIIIPAFNEAENIAACRQRDFRSGRPAP